MRIAVFLIILFVIQIYAYQAVRSATGIRWIHYLYFMISGMIIGNVLLRAWLFGPRGVTVGIGAYGFGFLLTLLTGQLVLVLLMFGEDIFRFVMGIFNKVTTPEEDFYMPSRRSFIGKMALGLAAIPFSSMLYGMFKGKYDFRVLRYELEFADLPEEFDGYRITQISDIHCGSFDNFDKIKYGVDLIKAEKSDVILFTGDLVNNFAYELDEWKDLFASISAPDGVYSVLGNHDYGMYHEWPSQKEKNDNLEKIKSIQREMGWNLLLNENRILTKGNDRIHIIGVENWGTGGFPKYGDIEKAAKNLSAKDFKIMLSHDPSHWEEMLRDDDRNFQLTLSGHTHGMQFGVEIPGWIKWSPVRYRYKHWAGVYKEAGRFINVNRGFGYIGYPGRVGIWPEITVIRLKKKHTNSPA